jgi:hypothetical protein
MIIHNPKIEKKGDKVRVSAYIEVETKKEYSDTLWYEFDKEYEEYISASSNGFVAAMLFLAMYLGEDIEVKGSLSPKLAYGLKEFQRFFNFWHPEDFKIVKITCNEYEIEKNTPEGVMCTFSGGVDSFYTLYQHLPEIEDNPYHQLTHCLLLDGFAIPRTVELNHSYKVIRESYEKLTRKHGIKLVFVATNLADFFHGRIPSVKIDGPILASVPLILGRLISTFHIASCLAYSQILPRGSNAITNSLLSTEKLTVTMHGSDQSRVEKTIAIANWPETYDKLRVCWEDIGVKNCCRCEKCVRTMITLKAAGVLSKYTTFPLPLTRKGVRHWQLYEKHNFWFAKEIIDYAKTRGRDTMVFDVKYAMVRSKILKRVFWAPSAALKKRSKTYSNFVKLVKRQT